MHSETSRRTASRHWLALQHQLSAVGGRILLADRYACANDPALCAHGLVVPETSGGRTQWHQLSAADTCLLVPSGLQSNGRDLLLCAAQTICVIVDSKEVVGRRRRRRAGVHRHRPQGQRSPLWPQWAAAWPPVPHSGSVECGTSAPSKLLSTKCHAYVHMTHATSLSQVRT